MFIKYSLAAAVVLATASVTALADDSGPIFTVPIHVHNIPENRNAAAVTKHYLRKRQAASSDIALTSVFSDILYTVPMTLGTPPQKFNMAIDTGSYVTWVVADTCISGACANITNHYTCASSSTCEVSNTPFSAQYVSGDKVSGRYMTEQYTIGNLNFKAVAGLVDVNQASLPATVDGIMGLWPTAPDNSPILKVLTNTKALTKNQIGVWLESNPVPNRNTKRPVNAPGGEITFGGANPARYKEPVTYINCVGVTPWIARYGWFLPCEGTASITITFGGFVTSIPYKTFALQDNYATLNTGQILCMSSVMYPTGSIVATKDWLLGAVFMKNMYTIFDFSTPTGRIGFAQLAVNGSPGTGPVGAIQPGGGNNNTGGNNNNNNNNGSGNPVGSAASRLRAVQALTVVAAAAGVVAAAIVL
ncbi:hypothetical protein BGX23_003672 [Mortierella sp. AD031]|nr:hypothetical protein BGX23_003672 [Mortierella sp. AD031]KAG0211081.1 hypothetical protein BGX33_004532 [Mortierella sp. NVP41]